MKQESETKPTTGYEIENIEGDICDVVFYDLSSIEEKEVTSEDGNEKVSYFYLSYRVNMSYSEKLNNYISKNYDTLLEGAKSKCYADAAAAVRAKRNKLLQESDKEVVLDRLEVPKNITISNVVSVLKQFFESMNSNWTVYRQELRDITKQDGFPFDVTFPTKPKE